MKAIKIASSFLTSATLFLSILPAFADTPAKTNLPDLSNTENPLAACKTINVGTADHTKTQSTSFGTLDSFLTDSSSGVLVGVSTQKDIQPVIGHDCDGIADSISRVETNREDNKTDRYIVDRQAEVQLLKNFMSW